MACYHDGEEQSCRTEYVERDAAVSCGCDTGCSCSGLCEYQEEPVTELGIQFDDIEIPERGLKLIFEGQSKDQILSDLNNEAYVGSHRIDNVWFGENFALYKINSNGYLIFPVENEVFTLKDCAGEYMAKISMNYSM